MMPRKKFVGLAASLAASEVLALLMGAEGAFRRRGKHGAR
jgi:hypothetical protein